MTRNDAQKEIGKACREWRMLHSPYTLNDISKATGYSNQNISAFEHGRNNSAVLLLWYVANGFDVTRGDRHTLPTLFRRLTNDDR